MVQGRAFLLACATALAAAGSLAACSGDDNSGTPSGTMDGGTDGSPIPDGSTHDGSADTGPATDAGDGGDACDFNTFVIGLIQNHTNGTDQPSTDLGQNCTDTHTAFPMTVFQ
jgi:hypothetical protein